MPRFSHLQISAICGSLYGLGLARFIFESQPQRFQLLAAWPGVLGVAVVCGVVLVVVAHWLRAPLAARPFASIGLLLPLVSALAPDVNLLRAQALLLAAPVLFLLLAFTAEGDEEQDSRNGFRPLSFGFPLLLFLLLFLLYLPTLGPTVGEADTFEFQVSIARLGVAHGNGYPLLMLLGKVFTWLPVGGTLAWRANLTSAFFAALAAVGVERIARRLGCGPLTAALAGFAFGVSPGLWARATEIEAYTLNAAFTAAILYLCLVLVDSPLFSQQYQVNRLHLSFVIRHSSLLYLLAFLFGLGLTNHLTILLLAPACLLAVVLAYIRRPLHPAGGASQLAIHNSQSAIRHSPFIILFFLLGLSVFLYIPLRWPAVNHGELLSLERFLYFLRGGEARGYLNPLLPFQDWSRYAPTLRKMLAPYTPIGFGLALVGAASLLLPRPREAPLKRSGRGGWPAALVLGLAYAGFAYFAVAYNTREPDWSDFFIPLHLIAAVLMGVGLQFLIRNSQFLIRNSITVHCLLLTFFSLLPLRSLWLALPQVDRSDNWENYRLGQYTLNQPLAQDATILADPAHLAPLYYLQVTEGLRPDLDVVLLPDEASYRAVLDERLAAGQTVYVARYLPGLGSAYSLRSVGPLAEVSPQPFTAPVEIAQPLALTPAPNLHLLGYRADALRLAAPGPLRLTLFWRAGAPADDNYLVSLRLRDVDGNVAWQSAGSVPVNGLYPTNAWRPGETISDFYTLPINARLSPGDYRLEVALSPPFAVSEAGWGEITQVKIIPGTESPRPPHPLRARFGTTWLMGYAAPESSAPGSQVALTLYWLRSEEASTVTAFGETRDIHAWPLGDIVPIEYRLTTPKTGGQFELVIEAGRPARCGWLAPITTSCSLPSVRLAGEAVAEGAVNYDNQILLRSATLATPNVERGGIVAVNLQWQALTTIREDYTVFVHLVGPDGALHGQVDYWPQGGTIGTSQWKPGQVIDDPYRVQLAADAPPGTYTVHIGFYLLATLERLPVLNADGRPVDDKVVLTGLTVK